MNGESEKMLVSTILMSLKATTTSIQAFLVSPGLKEIQVEIGMM